MQIGSEEFRNNWGANVERVLSGVVITIQRYSRPAMVMMPYTKYKEMADRLAQFEAAIAGGTQAAADPEFGAAVLQLGEKVRMGTVIQQLGEQITAEADANGSWISGGEFLERAKKRSGTEYVAAILEERQAVNVAG